MTYAHPEASRSTGSAPKLDSDRALETWFGARARRILGMAALAVLVTWLAVSARQTPEVPELSPDRDSAAQSLENGQRPVFDGRGKWTGYAR